MKRSRFASIAALSLFVALPLQAADADYPSKPIRLLVGYAPASGADVVARILAAKLQETFKSGVVVENKPGAGGQIAAQETVRATSNGYTLMLGAMPQISIAPATNPKLPYDPLKQLAPVSQVVGTDLVLITNPQKVTAGSMQEFVAWSQSQPALFFGTPGPGTVGHFGAYFLADVVKAKIEPVHFKSTADSLTAMLSGDIHAQFVPFAVAAPLVKAGKLRALLVTGPERTPLFPETPTSREAGYPDVQFTSWYGVFAPVGTPADILDKLSAEVVKATHAAQTRARLEDAGLRVTGTGRQEFDRIIRTDAARWGKVVEATGFKAQD